MTIDAMWNKASRDQRAELLAGMGVESSRNLQAWSATEWDRLPEVVQFGVTAELEANGEAAANLERESVDYWGSERWI